MIGLGAVCVAAMIGRAGADETVRLDPRSELFDRRIPSSQGFTLEVPVPGKDAVGGELELWPARRGGCATRAGERQHHRLAMTASGSDADRVLRAVVPALQVDTSFCFQVRITRGLDEAGGIGFAGRVADGAMRAIDLDTACLAPEPPAAKLAAAVAGAIAKLAAEESAAELAPGRRLESEYDAATANAIGVATVTGLDLVALCAELRRAGSAAKLAGDLAGQASSDLERSLAVVLPLGAASNLLAVHPVRARLPLLITGAAPSYQIASFAQAADEDALVVPATQALEPIAPQLAQRLRDLGAAAAADKPQKRQLYLAELAKLAPAPAVLASGADRQTSTIDDLFRIAPNPGESPGALRASILERRRLVLDNLGLLKRQLAVLAKEDPANANAWVGALDAIRVAVDASRAANAEVKTRLDGQDAARLAVATRLRERLTTADVRALVHRVSQLRSQQQITAPQTDEGAASVSADLGVLLALPFHVDAPRNGWEPWLVPYAGVNIYAERVDRVVPFHQLVGSWAKQRLSFTAGALLTRPEINGAKISLPFRDSGIIPVVALGVRLTSFTRASIGGFVFDYQDANPASAKKHTAGAIWIGLSIDADVWAAVQGKAFR